MKERGILFSAPMVRAILADRKTQTRRVVRELPGGRGGLVGDHVKWFERGQQDATRWCGHDGLGSLGWVTCPYGEPGDRLWVRETHAQFAVGNRTGTSPQCVAYRATCDEGGSFDYVNNGDEVMRLKVTKWTPSIFMPRWASRITLEIAEVRVQRLQDISEDDARAEGVEPYTPPHGHISPDQRVPGPGFDRCRLGDQPHRLPFADLWDLINGKRASWASSPWVWAISFRRIDR